MAHEPKITQFDGTKQIEHTLIEYSELSDLRDKDKFGRRAWEMLKDKDEHAYDGDVCHCIGCETLDKNNHEPNCPLKALLDEGEKLYGGN